LGLVKRGVFGTYHHWGRGYMQQHLNEFDFRYNHRKVNDSERTLLVLKATEGKRLTLRQPKSASSRVWEVHSSGEAVHEKGRKSNTLMIKSLPFHIKVLQFIMDCGVCSANHNM
jgi:hypothetical protein